PGVPRELGTVQQDAAGASQTSDGAALGVDKTVVNALPASSSSSRFGRGSLQPDCGSTSLGYMTSLQSKGGFAASQNASDGPGPSSRESNSALSSTRAYTARQLSSDR